MLEIKNLTKMYGSFRALNQLNLTINKGEVFGFVGPNGAGKTTTMRIICGLLQPTYGEVMLDDIDAIKHPEQIKRKVGYVPDFFGVYDNFTVMEYMEFYGSMYDIDKKTTLEISEGLLELVNLSDKKEFYVDSLSRGMKQRLCVARAMIHDPELLILDEPASGLDPRARFELKEIMKNLGSMGKTIIISSHILPELAEMCDTIGIMEKGNLIAHGSVSEITKKAQGTNPILIDIVRNRDLAIQLLKEYPGVRKIAVSDDRLTVAFEGDDTEMAGILKQLVLHDVVVTSFAREKGNLETVFMDITNQVGQEGAGK